MDATFPVVPGWDVAGVVRAVVRLDQSCASVRVAVAVVVVRIAVTPHLPQRSRHVRLLDGFSALGELDEFVQRARRGLHVAFLPRNRERAFAQHDPDGDLPFDLPKVGVVVPQQRERVEMVDGELLRDHVVPR